MSPGYHPYIFSHITNGIIKNSNITKKGVLLAAETLRKSGYAEQEKTIRTQQLDDLDASVAMADLPPMILIHYKTVELSVDMLFVNGIPFLTTVSKHIHYGLWYCEHAY